MKKIFHILAATALLLLAGCASDGYRDDKEYSDMPWNTPQSWEGSRSIPGLSPGY
jgi:outer membrane biogenesis lipoprotein LolB